MSVSITKASPRQKKKKKKKKQIYENIEKAEDLQLYSIS